MSGRGIAGPNGISGGSRPRCYRGRTLTEALARLRASLGDHAYVLGNRRRRKYRWFGPLMVEVLAVPGFAPEAGAPAVARARAAPVPPVQAVQAGPGPRGRSAGDGAIQEALAELLSAAGVLPELARSLARRALENERRILEVRQLAGALGGALAAMTGGAAPLAVLPGTKRVACFVGPAGGGKTTAVAKLACRLSLGEGRLVELVNLDTARAGAADALARYAEILGLEHYTAYTPGELRRRIAASPADVVLVDTGGANWRNAGELGLVAEQLEAAAAAEVHLVLPATLDPGQAERLIPVWRPFGMDRLLLTRIDEVDSYGPVVNLACTARIPVSYLSAGGSVPEQLGEPDFVVMAEALMAGRPPAARQEKEVARVG